MQLPRGTLSALAIAGFLQPHLASTAAVPAIVSRTAIGLSVEDLINAVISYLSPQNAYVCQPFTAIVAPRESTDQTCVGPNSARQMPHHIRDLQRRKLSNVCQLRYGRLTWDFIQFQSSLLCRRCVNCFFSLGVNVSNVFTGRNYFSDPSIGDFSVTYTKAGGVNGDTTDGLHSPVLHFANIGNNEDLNIDDLLTQQDNSGAPGKLCATSGDLNSGEGGQLAWQCGIPVIGQALFGISNYKPVTSSGYKPGWCTMHIVQWQRNEDGVGADYDFDVLIYDAAKTLIGEVAKAPVDPVSKALSVNSNLPSVMVVTAGAGDDDPIGLAYGSQIWLSNDPAHQSDFGSGPDSGYENGKREGDMGFNC